MTDCQGKTATHMTAAETGSDASPVDADMEQSEDGRTNPLEEALVDLINRTTSVAPRDVALMVAKPGKDWRIYLQEIKSIAQRLEAEGTLVFVRKGRAVSSKGLKGVYRFARPDAPLKPPKSETTGASDLEWEDG